jgi:hypothetical protein
MVVTLIYYPNFGKNFLRSTLSAQRDAGFRLLVNRAPSSVSQIRSHLTLNPGDRIKGLRCDEAWVR